MTAAADSVVCANQLPFTWNGINITAAGSYPFTTQSAAGCDSTITLTVTVSPVITAAADTVVCANQLPFTWNGINITAAGSYPFTTQCAVGCDYTITLTVSVSPVITAVADTVVCANQLPFTWNGINITAAGSYPFTTQSVAGCDSTITLTVTVSPVITAVADTVVCANQLPFTWNGINITAAGSYPFTTQSAAGCDSTITLTVTVSPVITAVADTVVCANQLPFTWNGINITAAGSYPFTTQSVAGCDSTIRPTVSRSAVMTAFADTVVCANQLPFTWNGINITAAGSYPFTTQSVAGCDSTITLTVTVSPVITAVADTVVCANQLPFTWNGINITAAGSYPFTTQSVAGCDSTITLTVTVSPVITAVADTVVCANQLPFTWNGINITAAGSYPFTTQSAAGCDSTITLTVTVSPVITAVADTVVCANQLPFTWNGINITAAGSYPFTTQSVAGCDSTIRPTVSRSAVMTAFADTVVCANQLPFTWNGINITAAGSYPFTTQSVAGCDSTITLTVTVSPVITAVADTVVCANQLPFTWNGINITAAGSYPFTTQSVAGCDSTITLNVTVSPVITAVADTVVCANQLPFTWNGINITAAGSYPFTTQSVSGCDSTITLTLTVSLLVAAVIDTVVCANQLPFTWNGINITAAGSYPFTTQSVAGCDSTITLTVTVSPVITAVADTVVCANQLPFTWNGINITAAGSYPFTTQSVACCDSTITLTVSVSPVITAVADTVVCANQLPFTWNGINITAAGSYPFTTQSVAGCDSTITLTVTVSPVITAVADTVVCANQLPFTWNGINITAAGSYPFTTQCAVGCDYTITLTVSVSPVITAVADTVVCANQLPFTWNGINITAAGSYPFTTQSVAGCDSTITLTVTVSPVITAVADTVVCANQLPFTWNGINITAAGSYPFTTQSAAGCDSTITLTVTVSPVITAVADTVVCANQLPFTWNGINITAAGSYPFTTQSVAGCDSTIRPTVSRSAVMTAFADTVVCANQLPFTWNGINITAAGSYPFTTQSVAGCDSTITLTVTVSPVITAVADTVVCANQLPFTWNGINITAAGSYPFTTQSVAGCDSTIRPTVSRSAVMTAVADTVVCANQLPFTWNGINITAAGSYPFTTQSVAGCDSTITLTVTVSPVITAVADTVVCANQLPFTWNGINITAAGSYPFTTQSAAGCDSTITLTVTVSPVITAVADTVVCANQLPFTWNGINITAAGSYPFTTQSVAGCDSTIRPTVSRSAVMTAFADTVVCANQLPFTWNGINITAAGSYPFTTQSVAGCDSTITLTVTVSPVITAVADTVVCANQLPFTWNGINITAAGSYPFTTQSVAGCDSTITLTVTVSPVITAVADTVVCANQLPFTWNGINITAAGSYPFTTQSAAGCDSTITLTVTVSPVITAVADTVVCANQLPFTWNGINITAAGSYPFTTQSVAGCDSTIRPTVSRSAVMTAFADTVVCANQLPFTWNGINITAAGSYPFTTQSVAGCDSTITLTVTVSPVITAVADTVVCANQLPFTWNGINITAAGSYPFTTQSVAGCDSTIRPTVSRSAVMTAFADTVVCANQLPFTWNGINITAAGSYPFTTQSVAGCDSTITLTVTVSPVITAVADTVVCANQLPFTWNGINITAAGSYPFTTQSVAGCDSTIRPTVSRSAVMTAFADTVVCANQLPFTWNGINITAAGSYPFTTQSVAGCDSTITLTVTVSPVITAVADTVVCANQLPFTWNGINITAAGSYPFTTQSVAGCDSTIRPTVSRSAVMTAFADTVVCANQLPFTWNGINITAAGSYPFTTQSVAGCDSTITLTVTVSPVITAVADTVVCANQLPFTWNGINITAAGSYPFTTQSVAGCDSTITLTVTVSPVITAVADTVVCANQLPFTWNGINISEERPLAINTKSVSGFDSIITLTVTVSPVITAVADTVVCANQLPFTWNGINITAAGSYPFTTQSVAGCDSTITLTVTVSPVITAAADTVVCANQLPFTWNGININAAGSYPFTTQSAAGCDSTITLTVTVSPVITAAADSVVCANQLPFTWNGINITAAGSYPFTTQSAAGCDSTITLTVTVSPVITAAADSVVCANQLPFTWNGINITAAGSYPFTTQSVAGCDSTITLTVTVSPVITAAADTVVCANQLPFTWNGINITAAGSYPFTTQSVAGCDSTITLTVTVSPVITTAADTVVCANQLPFTWNGINITAAGSYPFTTQSAAGCDSTITLTVTVSPVITAVADSVVCPNQLPSSRY